MRYKSRPWQLAAGLSAVVLIAAGVIFYLRMTSHLSAGEMLSYMPQEESTLFYMDLRAIRQSGLLEKLVGSTVPEEAEYKNFVSRTNFNYKTDLDSVLASSRGNTRLFLLQGRFDWDSLSAYAAKQGGSCSGEFCRVPGEQPEKSISFRLLRRNLLALAVSPNKSAASEVAKRDGQTPDGDLPGAPIWIKVPASILQDADNLPSGTRLFVRAVSNAEQILLTVGPEQDRLEVAMDVTCKTQEEAAILKAQLEGITSMLQKLIARENKQPDASDLSGILTAGQFERQNRHVLARWPLPKEFIDALSSGGKS
ncbi:MAG: hypothetical protein ACRD7E_02005 [Bryobacteraceae bacterium]